MATPTAHSNAKAPARQGMLQRGAEGQQVRDLQRQLARHGFPVAVDGEFGPDTDSAVRMFQAEAGLEVDGVVGPKTRAALDGKPRRRAKKLNERAYRVAAGLVGVMEVGGNNRGPMVMRIIRANGGAGPEAWCGDFVAYCYKQAGSKSVTRSWAAVRLIRGLLGIRATGKPRRGDLVRFNFDHVGMFVRDRGNGTIETIEGNTGRSGAVSDSKTGGDGVYRKIRSKSLVNDYLRVTR